MRPADAIVQRQQLQQQRLGERGAAFQGQRRKIDVRAQLRLLERAQHVREPRNLVRGPKTRHAGPAAEAVEARADHAALVVAGKELFEQRIADGGLTAAFRAADQDRVARRREVDLPDLLAVTDDDACARLRADQVAREQLICEFQEAVAPTFAKRAVRRAPGRSRRIAHCGRVFGQRKQRQIVVVVSDRGEVMRRDAELSQRNAHTVRLVHAGRQDAEHALIRDEPEIELQLAQRLAYALPVRLQRRDARAAHRQRRDVAALQLLQQDLRRRLRQDRGLARSRPIHHGAVLSHDVVEHARLGKNLQKLAQLAAGDQDELAAAGR